MTKKEQVKKLVSEMIQESAKSMESKIDHLLSSGCIDIESWDIKQNPMVLPKTIVVAMLERESKQYRHPSKTREQNKDIKNYSYYL